MQIDSRTLGYVLRIRPHTSIDDILRLEWINDWDVLIQFKDGEKYVYDTYSNYFKWICYTRETITEEQWRKEFRDKLNSMMDRKNITQEMLADLLECQQPMISRYCSGSAMPSPYMIHKIARALDCRDEDLLYKDY